MIARIYTQIGCKITKNILPNKIFFCLVDEIAEKICCIQTFYLSLQK